MRGVFEVLGASIEWDNENRSVTATAGETTIRITLDSQEAVVNNRTIQLEKPARIINGSTMVPRRFVAEALGASVNWDASRQTAVIESAAGKSTAGSYQVQLRSARLFFQLCHDQCGWHSDRSQ